MPKRLTVLRTAVHATFVTLALLPGAAHAQIGETEGWAAQISNQYRVIPNVTYLTANSQENKVDLYLPRGADRPTPTLLYFHGGGWVGGNKEANVLRLLPYLEMGWAVVNVQYRLGRVSLAPAAVEDCLRLALGYSQRGAVQPRHLFDRGDRPFSGGAPLPDHRDGADLGGPGSAMPGQ